MGGSELSEASLKRLACREPQLELYDQDFSFGGSFGVRVSTTGIKVFFVFYPMHGRRKRRTRPLHRTPNANVLAGNPCPSI